MEQPQIPVTPLVDILSRLTGMLNDLIGDADRIAKDYPGIIAHAHGRPGSPPGPAYAGAATGLAMLL